MQGLGLRSVRGLRGLGGGRGRVGAGAEVPVAGALAEVPQPSPRLAKEGEVFEPDFSSDGAVPLCPRLRLDLRGYDYQVLERYQAFVGKLAGKFRLAPRQVKSWALPGRRWEVTNLRPRSSVVEARHSVEEFQRCVVLEEVPSTTLGPLLAVVAADLPEGVRLSVAEHRELDEEERYVPDYELQALQRQLRSLDEPAVRSRLGWNPDVRATWLSD